MYSDFQDAQHPSTSTRKHAAPAYYYTDAQVHVPNEISDPCCTCFNTSPTMTPMSNEINGSSYKGLFNTVFNIDICAGAGGTHGCAICGACADRVRAAGQFKMAVAAAQDKMKRHLAAARTTMAHHPQPEESIRSPGGSESGSSAPSEEALECQWRSLDGDAGAVHVSFVRRERQRQRRTPRTREGGRELLERDRETPSPVYEDAGGVPAESPPPQPEATEMTESEMFRQVYDGKSTHCLKCHAEFTPKNNVNMHFNEHFPNYKCELCNRAFATKSRLKAHQYRHKIGANICSVCGKICKSVSSLGNHIRMHNRLPHTCPHCPERFKYYHQRKRHLVSAHNYEEKFYKCNICSKAYLESSSLNKHINDTHLQKRSYACPDCSMSYFRKESLDNHMSKHTGVKKFICEVCCKGFTRASNLKTHMKCHLDGKIV